MLHHLQSGQHRSANLHRCHLCMDCSHRRASRSTTDDMLSPSSQCHHQQTCATGNVKQYQREMNAKEAQEDICCQIWNVTMWLSVWYGVCVCPYQTSRHTIKRLSPCNSTHTDCCSNLSTAFHNSYKKLGCCRHSACRQTPRRMSCLMGVQHHPNSSISAWAKCQ